MRAAILVVGNARSMRERQDSLRDGGVEVDWQNVDNDKAAPRRVGSICARIEGGSFAAVVILQGFVAHRLTIAIEHACRRTKVPFAYGGRGGRREIREAVRKVQRRMEARP